MSFSKVRSGDRVVLGAPFLNRLIDVANSPVGTVSGRKSGNNDPSIILVKNISGSFVEANGILGLGDSLITPAAPATDDGFRFNRPVIEGDNPNYETHFTKFCILLDALDDDEVGGRSEAVL